MKSKVISIMKRVYSRLLKYDFFWKRRKKLKRLVRKIRRYRLKKYNESVYSRFGQLSIEDTNFINIECAKKTDNKDIVFGFDVLGQIDHVDQWDYIEYCSELQGILDNNDINIKIAITDEDIDDNILKYFSDKVRLYTITKNTNYIMSCEDYKVAFIGFKIPEEEQIKDGFVLDDNVIKNILYAKQQNVNYIVAYVLRNTKNSIITTPYEKKFLRELANIGCNAVFCSNYGFIHAGGNIKKLNGRYTSCISSMGTLFGHSAEVKGSALAIRFKILLINGIRVVNKGYIPLYNNILSDGTAKAVTRIDYHNSEHRRDKAMMDALKYIEDETSDLRDIRNILTIKDICNILDVELPDQYSYLANVSIGKVCARSFEVKSGDVFFFREPFADNNDGEPAPLEKRLKIVDKAVNRGARFVFSYVDLDESIPHIKIENTREAHIKVCAYIRQLYEVRTVGITGSVGKTSTKDMLYNVLNEKYDTHKNLRNSNTQVNIGMHIQDFRGGYEFFIQEIGGGRPGGASRHSRMILPEATIITNIGHAHIGNYGTQENLMANKLGIIEGMDDKGTLFLNADDPLLWTARVDADTVFFGVNNKEADYYADNIVENSGQTFFEIVNGESRVPAMLNVLGEYNVLNAVCCYAVGKKFGISDAQIVEGISKFETSGVRQNLMKIAGYDLFVDCFNASPRSVETSLSVLEKIETDKKKIAVIGDVTGMAELSDDIHVEIGEIVKQKKMDLLICYGEASKTVHEMALESGINSVNITDADKLEYYIKKNAEDGDVILFKGSGKMKLAERIDSMFGTMLADQGYIDKVALRKINQGRARYNVYPEYATVVNCQDFSGTIKIADNIKGKPVYNLGEGAFSDKENVTGFRLPNRLRHIGAGCFYGCGTLKNIKLPKTLKYVGASAFAECRQLEKVILPDGVLHLDDKVFYGCSNLKEVYLPSTIKQMGKDIFDNCENLIVSCKEGSYAAKYCEENGVHYQMV